MRSNLLGSKMRRHYGLFLFPCLLVVLTYPMQAFLAGTSLRRNQARFCKVSVAATKVSEVIEKLSDRDVFDTALKVAPFLDEDARKEFLIRMKDMPQSSQLLENNLPAINDTVLVLYQKQKKLKTDADVIAFRNKLQTPFRQAIQELIEVEQSETASALAGLKFEDEAEAEEAWQIFKKQYPKPAETGRYMTTPTKEADIKYRWRRLKELLDVDSDTALFILEKDSSPMFVDPDFIRRAWKAMCEKLEGGREEALNDLVLKHPGILIADASIVKEQLLQAKITAAAIDFTRGIFSFARGASREAGRRDDISSGGGLPAWRRRWEEESKGR